MHLIDTQTTAGEIVPARDLPSWTRSLPEDDVLLAMGEAEPGLSLREWRQRCDRVLPHASPIRRREVLTFILRGVLDHDGQEFASTRFVRLVRGFGAQGQRDLLWGRYLFTIPIVDAALREVVAPIASLLDEPLVPTERLQVSTEQWKAWLATRLRPGSSGKSAHNARGNLLTALRRVGIVTQAAGALRTTQVRHATPEPLAFAWLVGHEMRGTHRVEAPERWAVGASFAARLFLPSVQHAEVCIEQGIAAGLLIRSYLAGEPRILLPVEA
jgi:hypothetical protein